MKFEYEVKDDRGHCVVCVDEYGDLLIKSDDCGSICITKSGPTDYEHSFKSRHTVHRFHKGDKVTITF